VLSKRLIGERGVFHRCGGSINSIAALSCNLIRSSLMSWFVILLLIVIGVPVFTWAYRRHLDVLIGPWIASEKSRHD
jgi:hypothetical protein